MSKRGWFSIQNALQVCDLTEKEIEEATKKARKDLLRNAKPSPKNTQPFIVVTVGAPGAGKSTVGRTVAKTYSENFVEVDLDLAVKYHPRFNNMWVVPEKIQRSAPTTKIGIIEMYLMCNNVLIDMMNQITNELTEGKAKYNILLQASVDVSWIVEYKKRGYKVILLYVGVPLKIAQRRAWERSLRTGQFFERTRREQDEFIGHMWADYAEQAPWYSLLADEILVVDNRKEFSAGPHSISDAHEKSILSSLKRFDPHKCSKDWTQPVKEIQKAISETQK